MQARLYWLQQLAVSYADRPALSSICSVTTRLATEVEASRFQLRDESQKDNEIAAHEDRQPPSNNEHLEGLLVHARACRQPARPHGDSRRISSRLPIFTSPLFSTTLRSCQTGIFSVAQSSTFNVSTKPSQQRHRLSSTVDRYSHVRVNNLQDTIIITSDKICNPDAVEKDVKTPFQ